MSWLLVFVPVTIGLEVLSPDRYLLIFITSPSPSFLLRDGWAGPWSSLQSAWAGELVGSSMRPSEIPPNSSLHLPRCVPGIYDVVKASIAGSIVGNILLVLGAAMLAGGLRRPEQHFNAAGARSQATMLMLAATALILPAFFQTPSGSTTGES
jgi:Ca2+:H+ antiporter